MLRRWGTDPLYALARHPRYRARRRREVRSTTQVVCVLTALVMSLDLMSLSTDAPSLVPINLVGIISALVLCLVVRGPLRRRPEPAALMVGFVAIGTTILPYLFDRNVAFVLLAYITLILVGSALFMPWSGRVHLAWLVSCVTMAVGFVLSPLGASLELQTGGRGARDLITISIAASIVSGLGFVLSERRRLRSLAGELQVRSLHARTREQGREMLRLYRELEILAGTDTLTGAGNRRRLHQDLLRIAGPMPAAVVAARPVRALAIVDVDRFKRYNDRYGHLAGDDILRRIAEVFATLPGADVYRFGGEEFLVAASFASVAEVGPAMDGLRRMVEDIGAAHVENRPWGRVTVSAGVDVRETVGPIDGEAWIRAADEALYRAKGDGRNRFVVVLPGGAEEEWQGASGLEAASA